MSLINSTLNTRTTNNLQCITIIVYQSFTRMPFCYDHAWKTYCEIHTHTSYKNTYKDNHKRTQYDTHIFKSLRFYTFVSRYCHTLFLLKKGNKLKSLSFLHKNLFVPFYQAWLLQPTSSPPPSPSSVLLLIIKIPIDKFKNHELKNSNNVCVP